MTGTGLRHLAVIAEGIFEPPDGGIPAALARAAATAAAAFAVSPRLEAFSFVAPEIDRRLADPDLASAAGHACAQAATALGASAAALGATVRVCGRLDGLPREVLSLNAGTAAPRTLLWFLRYGGRDEIARAATRFLRANPDRRLADGELDTWLDTAGLSDPDLVVLAGGELTVRDALLWQGSYAELWHTPLPWPRFTGELLREALASFGSRQRRFGR